MQPFLIVKNTDLIFNLKNDYIIIHTNLLGCATTKRRGKTMSKLQSTHNVCMQLCTDQYSLSLCTVDTPCVNVVSCNLIFCCVMQNDRTPLYWASFRGHTEIVAMLLKFGNDFSSCNMVSTSYFITPISVVSE